MNVAAADRCRTGEPFSFASGRKAVPMPSQRTPFSWRNCLSVFRRIIYSSASVLVPRQLPKFLRISSCFSNLQPRTSSFSRDGCRFPPAAVSLFWGRGRGAAEETARRACRAPRGRRVAVMTGFFKYPVLFYCKNVTYDIKYVYVSSRPCAGVPVSGPGQASMRNRGSEIQLGGVSRPSPAHAARSSLRVPQKKP